MDRFTTLILIIFLCLASFECKSQLIIEGAKADDYNLYSKWQSLNNSNLVIEFIKAGKYIIYKDQEEFFNFLFQIESIKNGVFNIILFADEYYRTEDLDSFRRHLKSVMKEEN